MNDSETTLNELKQAVIRLCLDKGWGVDGKQDPQHVAMALTVEASELLEQFQWLKREDVKALAEGGDERRRAHIAEEFADVMMYGLQLMYTLDIDISASIEKKIARVRLRDADYSERKRRFRDAFEQDAVSGNYDDIDRSV